MLWPGIIRSKTTPQTCEEELESKIDDFVFLGKRHVPKEENSVASTGSVMGNTVESWIGQEVLPITGLVPRISGYW